MPLVIVIDAKSVAKDKTSMRDQSRQEVTQVSGKWNPDIYGRKQTPKQLGGKKKTRQNETLNTKRRELKAYVTVPEKVFEHLKCYDMRKRNGLDFVGFGWGRDIRHRRCSCIGKSAKATLS